MLISVLMAQELSSEATMTRSLLARVPDDRWSWQAANDLHTIGWNANHLVEILSWVPGVLFQHEWDIAPVGGEPFVPMQAKDGADLLQSFDKHLAEAVNALRDVPDQTMDELWSLKMGGQTLFTMKKGDCIRKWIFSHTAHHRGILTVYLRLAGIPFPSIYEES